jgi:hypothetical protein
MPRAGAAGDIWLNNLLVATFVFRSQRQRFKVSFIAQPSHLTGDLPAAAAPDVMIDREF